MEKALNRGGKEKGEHFKDEIVVTGFAALEAVRLVELGRWSSKAWGDCRLVFRRILVHLVGSLRGIKRYAEAVSVVGEASDKGWINPETHAKLYLRAMQASMEGPKKNLPAARTARKKICTRTGDSWAPNTGISEPLRSDIEATLERLERLLRSHGI